MTDALRCPVCGASNAAGASWCGQCLTRFDAAGEHGLHASPAPREPEAASPPSLRVVHGPGVRRAGESLVWTCPSCDRQNEIDRTSCVACGTPMAQLFGVRTKGALRRTGRRAVTLSAVLPGAGHAWAGRMGDGIARGVLFLWTATIGIFLMTRSVRAVTVFRSVGAVFVLAAAGVWAMTLLESQRLSRGDVTPLLAGKALLWATVALTFILFVGLAAGARVR